MVHRTHSFDRNASQTCSGSNGPRNRADEKLLQYFTLFNGGVVHIVTENDNELVSRSVEPNMGTTIFGGEWAFKVY